MIAYRAMPAQLSTTITQPTCNNADFADPLQYQRHHPAV